MDRESLQRLAALASSCLDLVEAQLERAQPGGLRMRVVRLRLVRLKQLVELLGQLARAGKR